MIVSIVIRTYNEAEYLQDLLESIKSQSIYNLKTIETIVVDSGSTDQTIEIANKYLCKIVDINKSDFTFGRSLNVGCSAAKGKHLVFISGHCIPENDNWLQNIITPLQNSNASYVYGRQIGNASSKFSECRHFNKYFPDKDCIPQNGFFCNNANSAIKKETWQKYKFNEELTGLEDMELAKRLVLSGKDVGYSASACVYHIHTESWARIKHRYEREAIALQHIMPEVQVSFMDFIKFFISAVYFDLKNASNKINADINIFEIFAYRLMQFWGTYRGNHEHRKLSKDMKQKYYYPN